MTTPPPETVPTWLERLTTAAKGVRDAIRARDRAEADQQDAEQRRLQAQGVFDQHLADLRAILNERSTP